MLELTIILIYLSGMVAVGVASRRKARGVDDFFVAGRSGSTFLITGSLLATVIGGSATVGIAGLGFEQGLTGAWWLLVGSVGLSVLGLLFARKVRAAGLYTLPELVGEQYDDKAALAASLLIVISWVGVVAGQIAAAGNILSALGAGSISSWMIVSAMVFVIYTILGGQYSVIRTDTIQIVVIFGGVFGSLALLLSRLGGFGSLRASLPEAHLAFPLSSQFGLKQLVTLLILVGSTYIVGPDMYTRLFCARNENVARTSTLWTAFFIMPLAFCITMMGMGARVLFPGILPEQAFPTVMKEVLPPALNGIVLAALLCSVMSSADTCLLSASTILTVDVVGHFLPQMNEERTLFLSRWGIVVLGVCSLVLALALGGVIRALLFAYTVYTCGLILPVICGFYRKKLRVNSRGALAAIIGGGGAALAGELLDIECLGLGGFVIGGLLLFMVSLLTHKKEPLS